MGKTTGAGVLVCVCFGVARKPTQTTAEEKHTPGEVLMLRLRVKSSLRALRTAAMSALTSSRLMMSSTRAELRFTFAAWLFVLAWGDTRRRNEGEEKDKSHLISAAPFSRQQNLSDLLPSW